MRSSHERHRARGRSAVRGDADGAVGEERLKRDAPCTDRAGPCHRVGPGSVPCRVCSAGPRGPVPRFYRDDLGGGQAADPGCTRCPPGRAHLGRGTAGGCPPEPLTARRGSARIARVQAYVAVTDRDWYRALRDRRDLDEVNFWQPGGNRQFRALQPGEPFLFKLHAPDNVIVGGGFFIHLPPPCLRRASRGSLRRQEWRAIVP